MYQAGNNLPDEIRMSESLSIFYTQNIHRTTDTVCFAKGQFDYPLLLPVIGYFISFVAFVEEHVHNAVKIDIL